MLAPAVRVPSVFFADTVTEELAATPTELWVVSVPFPGVGPIEDAHDASATDASNIFEGWEPIAIAELTAPDFVPNAPGLVKVELSAWLGVVTDTADVTVFTDFLFLFVRFPLRLGG